VSKLLVINIHWNSESNFIFCLGLNSFWDKLTNYRVHILLCSYNKMWPSTLWIFSQFTVAEYLWNSDSDWPTGAIQFAINSHSVNSKLLQNVEMFYAKCNFISHVLHFLRLVIEPFPSPSPSICTSERRRAVVCFNQTAVQCEIELKMSHREPRAQINLQINFRPRRRLAGRPQLSILDAPRRKSAEREADQLFWWIFRIIDCTDVTHPLSLTGGARA